MRFNDGAADAKSHAGPSRLSRKERIKDLIGLSRGQPHAGIVDREHQLPVLAAASNAAGQTLNDSTPPTHAIATFASLSSTMFVTKHWWENMIAQWPQP
jgi:hypothetical protein